MLRSTVVVVLCGLVGVAIAVAVAPALGVLAIPVCLVIIVASFAVAQRIIHGYYFRR